MKKKLLISTIIVFVIFLSVIVFIYTHLNKGVIMWEYKGAIFENINPDVGGDMYVNDADLIYIFDKNSPPLIEIADYNLADIKNPGTFSPPFKEAWMEDTNERFNRQSTRLFKTSINDKPALLFHEYSQNSYWWKDDTAKSIYIVTEWLDAKKNEKPYLTFWKSIDGGVSFSKINWNNHQIGRGKAHGMYFDSKGINGYIFVDKNIVLQTSDSGENWHKVFISHTNSKSLPYTNNNPIDSATVDMQGNLFFSLFRDGNSYLYKIPANNKETDLSQITTEYQINNKRLLALRSVSNTNEFYMFYLPCKEQECTWYDYKTLKNSNKKNESLRFAHLSQGKYLTDLSLGFFLPLKNIYVDDNGKIAVRLNMINTLDNKLLLSDNFGKSWIAEDISGKVIISDYIDLKARQYWQYRDLNKLYLAKDIFK